MDEERAERNPFTLPSDEEVFRMRDEERKRRSKEREEQRKLKVWQKTTGGSRVAGSVRLKELIGGDGREGAAASKSARQTKDAVNEARSIVVNERRQEKENMAEFIAKKRRCSSSR
ncbi:coiled-coil domain [Aureococcus anophagefferens]|uniref:Coiled-coil domain n=1 Tax=Aureococcus anophagefferens TaxID=44056 RepID=A0ABR1FY52_AURAN